MIRVLTAKHHCCSRRNPCQNISSLARQERPPQTQEKKGGETASRKTRASQRELRSQRRQLRPDSQIPRRRRARETPQTGPPLDHLDWRRSVAQDFVLKERERRCYADLRNGCLALAMTEQRQAQRSSIVQLPALRPRFPKDAGTEAEHPSMGEASIRSATLTCFPPPTQNRRLLPQRKQADSLVRLAQQQKEHREDFRGQSPTQRIQRGLQVPTHPTPQRFLVPIPLPHHAPHRERRNPPREPSLLLKRRRTQ
mmetsp:Transcript_10673/g.29627  ORF Transcript_10673/g.29627 Transcript_10673/m.29627 type:complete len:254 (-) Transcript_10673:3272-4033(-)